jgi:hypothetical protein
MLAIFTLFTDAGTGDKTGISKFIAFITCLNESGFCAEAIPDMRIK